MRAQPARGRLLEVLCAVLLALAALPVAAQEGEGEETQPAEEEEVRRPPPPRSGSMFGSRPPQFSTSGGDDLTSGQVDRSGTDETDGRSELLVFDLEYAYGVEFRDSYRQRFETTLWEALEASTTYRPLSRMERQRRMARASQMVAGEVREEDAERIAEAIGVAHYLIPRIEVADSRTYLVRITVGHAGEGESRHQDYSRTSNRSVDNVDDAVEAMAEQAVAQ